ncbi:MAG: M20/M25/M40 family metallo-hydrolase [Candidatus Aegiribacteria sp.]|nr:M20/M25/M40 family metallo-hydrolase [Candidatus Aegiribacteria sp.]
MTDSQKLEIFSEILRYRTVSRQPGEVFDMKPFRETAEYLKKAFPRVHKHFRRETVGGGSLLFTLQGADRSLKPFMLTAHLDVVPADDGENWPEPPFSGKFRDGRIWGRGAIDYKAGVSGMLQACEDILERGFTPDRTVILAFGHDEEVGGNTGAAEIVRILTDRGVSLSSVLDEGGYIYSYPWMDRDIAVIGLAEKGYLTLRLTAHGVQGHASVPELNTAAGSLCRCLAELEKNQFTAKLCNPVEMMFQATSGMLGESVVVTDRSATPGEMMRIIEKWASGNALVRTTTAITMIRGSSKENIIPAFPHALVNFRAVPGDSSLDILNHVRSIAEPLGVDVQYEDTDQIHEPSSVASMDTDEYGAIQAAVRKIWPDIPVVPGIFPAATDSRHYCRIADNVYRFEPVHLGKDGLGALHSEGESITVEDYLNAVSFYTAYVRSVSTV